MIRISPPIGVAAILVTAFAGLAYAKRAQPNGEASQPKVSAEQCAVATAFLREELNEDFESKDGRKFFLTTEPTDRLKLFEPLSPELAAAVREDPFAELYSELEALNGVDPKAVCPSVRTFMHSREAANRFTAVEPTIRADDQFTSIILRMSVPVVSPDGREAIMFYGRVYGGLAGGGGEAYFKKNKYGRWVKKYEANHWVS